MGTTTREQCLLAPVTTVEKKATSPVNAHNLAQRAAREVAKATEGQRLVTTAEKRATSPVNAHKNVQRITPAAAREAAREATTVPVITAAKLDTSPANAQRPRSLLEPALLSRRETVSTETPASSHMFWNSKLNGLPSSRIIT